VEDTLKRLSMMAENRPAAAPNTRLARKSVRNLPKMVSMVPALSCGTGPMRCAAAARHHLACASRSCLGDHVSNSEDGRRLCCERGYGRVLWGARLHGAQHGDRGGVVHDALAEHQVEQRRRAVLLQHLRAARAGTASAAVQGAASASAVLGSAM